MTLHILYNRSFRSSLSQSLLINLVLYLIYLLMIGGPFTVRLVEMLCFILQPPSNLLLNRCLPCRCFDLVPDP